MIRPKGYLSLVGAKDEDGKAISLQKVVDYGWIKPAKAPRGFGIGRDEVPIGHNLWVDNGRQCMAYAIGNRTSITNFVITQFGIGTGSNVPNVTDTALQTPLTFYDTNADDVADSNYKPVTDIQWPSPFMLLVLITLAANEANGSGSGQLISEFGLFTANNTMVARIIQTNITKVSTWAPTFGWRLRI